MTLGMPGRPPVSQRERLDSFEIEWLARIYGISPWEIEDAWNWRPKSFTTLEQAAARAANLKEQRARRLAHETGAT